MFATFASLNRVSLEGIRNESGQLRGARPRVSANLAFMKGSKSTRTAEDRELEAIRKELSRAKEKLAKLEAKYKKVSSPAKANASPKTARNRKG